MTTAARPTFDPARGGSGRGEKDLSALSKQYSSRDLPSHTKLKYRDLGQGTSEELRSRDFREELEKREREGKSGGAGKANSSSTPSVVRRAIEASSSSKRQKIDAAPQNLDADDPVESENSDSDSDEDDTAALLAELSKIKRERAQDEAKKELEKRQEEERIRMENILSGNPLLNYASSAKADLKVKRRWDDDVVFKNCARSEPDKKSSQFINDSLRSEFHKKFMDKYIK
ncbi:protein CWC15 homolog [Toxorhynchites rutilus septentrionalis]|uniref:protein CWC15 homolog n=1 Tax=Toxorhynchites rutilus septentrionalis TaxID=329112 RepID=UPI002479CC6D|nr:protein CWC15 homolog [Toxorhynchites rutilus septentrionalis]